LAGNVTMTHGATWQGELTARCDNARPYDRARIAISAEKWND